MPESVASANPVAGKLSITSDGGGGGYAVIPGTENLVDGAHVTWDLNITPVANLVLGGSRTVDNPLNMVNGGTFVLFVRQDAVGNRVITWGNAFKWSGGAPTLSTGANAVDIFTFVSDGTFMYGAGALNFA